MLSLPFYKKTFTENGDTFVYASTTCALLLTLSIYGTIQGTLKVELFFYALLLSVVFLVWTMIDHKYRQSS